jgi:hypothetical protein
VPIPSHLAHVFSQIQITTKDPWRPSSSVAAAVVAVVAVAASLRQHSASTLTTRLLSRNASRMCVTNMSHVAANEDSRMIFSMRKSLRMALIDRSAPTFESSHDDVSAAAGVASVST